MAQRLKDKVALVTGGGMGIGRAIAEAFAREGARVVVADVNDQAGQEAVSAIWSAGGTASFVYTDVAEMPTVDGAGAHVTENYGRLDVLVCSAAIYARGDIVQTDVATFDRIMAVNLKGVFNCCKVAVPLMRQGGGGSIVNIVSSVG